MKTILVADDEPVSRHQLEVLLTSWGYNVLTALDGVEALETWLADRPPLAVVDWLMPGMEGPDLIRTVRNLPELGSPYVILLTAKCTTDDVIVGLDAGADDFLVKPFNPGELRARLAVGERMLDLQAKLARRVHELEEALSHVKVLEGIIPICMYCKKVRNEKEYWEKVEAYVSKRTDARFSHGICPSCLEKVEQAV